MDIELTLKINGEETKITKNNFNNSYNEILKLLEKACITYDYKFQDFVETYLGVIEKLSVKVNKDNSELRLGNAIITHSDGTIN